MMPNQNRKGFQEIVDEYDPEIIEVERGAFKESGTDIATIIVRIRKMTLNSIRLIRPKPRDTTRQDIEIRKIRERRTGDKVPYGEGEIDNTPTANVIQVDEVLSRSFLNAVESQRIPLSRRLLRWIEAITKRIW